MKEVLSRSLKGIKIHFEEAFHLELRFLTKELMEVLVTKINQDVIGKIDQEVELLSIELTGENTMDIKGKAGAMGILKEFVVHSRIVVHEQENKIAVEASDISIQGGFLVQKGFQLIEKKIKEKIEEKAVIRISDLLQQLPKEITIPGTSSSLHIDAKTLDMQSLRILPHDDEAQLLLKVKAFEIEVKAKEKA